MLIGWDGPASQDTGSTRIELGPTDREGAADLQGFGGARLRRGAPERPARSPGEARHPVTRGTRLNLMLNPQSLEGS